MGGKGDSGDGYVFQPSAEEQMAPITDMMGMMGEQNAMTQLMMQQNQRNTETMLANQNSGSVPTVTDYTDIDYDAENASLQEKINKQITDEESKRSGVLGTILSDEEEDPSTVTSSLLVGS